MCLFLIHVRVVYVFVSAVRPLPEVLEAKIYIKSIK